MVAKGWGKEKGKLVFNGSRVLQDEKVLDIYGTVI